MQKNNKKLKIFKINQSVKFYLDFPIASQVVVEYLDHTYIRLQTLYGGLHLSLCEQMQIYTTA